MKIMINILILKNYLLIGSAMSFIERGVNKGYRLLVTIKTFDNFFYDIFQMVKVDSH